MDATLFVLAAMQAGDGGSATDWPEAMVGIAAIAAGMLMVTAIVVVALWQGLGTWRARMSIAREQAYQKLAEEMAESQRATRADLERMSEDIAALRARTEEVERMMKEV